MKENERASQCVPPHTQIHLQIWAWVLAKEKWIQMPKTDIELEWLRFLLDTLYASCASDVFQKCSYISFIVCVCCVLVCACARPNERFHLRFLSRRYYHFSHEIQTNWIERLNYIHMLKSKSMDWCERAHDPFSLSPPFTIIFDRFLLHFDSIRFHSCHLTRSASSILFFYSLSVQCTLYIHPYVFPATFFFRSFFFRIFLFWRMSLLPPRSFGLVAKLRV